MVDIGIMMGLVTVLIILALLNALDNFMSNRK